MTINYLEEKEKTIANTAIKHFLRNDLISENFDETVNALIKAATIEMYGTEASEKVDEIEGDGAFTTIKNALNLENLTILLPRDQSKPEALKKETNRATEQKTRDFVDFAKDAVAYTLSHQGLTFNDLINDLKTCDSYKKINSSAKYRF